MMLPYQVENLLSIATIDKSKRRRTWKKLMQFMLLNKNRCRNKILINLL